MNKNLEHFEKNKFMYLFFAMVVYFVIDSLIADQGILYVTHIFFTLLIFVSIYVLTDEKRSLITIAVTLGILVALVDWIGDFLNLFSIALFHALWFKVFCSIIFFAIVTYSSLVKTLSQKSINSNVLFGASCIYLLLGLLWAYIYALIYLFNPNSFAYSISHAPLVARDLLYFSFITLTTVGFGDIVPLTNTAQTVTFLEAVMGQLYLAILIGQLVGLYITQKKMLERFLALYNKRKK